MPFLASVPSHLTIDNALLPTPGNAPLPLGGEGRHIILACPSFTTTMA